MAKKVCLRLRDLASGRGTNFTQPMTNIFGQLCKCQNQNGKRAGDLNMGLGRDSIGLKLTGVHFREHFRAQFRCKIHLGAF